jgi:magnesium-transporting ATPase (P-type)
MRRPPHVSVGEYLCTWPGTPCDLGRTADGIPHTRNRLLVRESKRPKMANYDLHNAYSFTDAHVTAIESERLSVFRIGLASNKPLLGAVSLTVILQFALVYAPFLQEIFKTIALSVADLVLSVVASSVIFWAAELEKWIVRHGQPR